MVAGYLKVYGLREPLRALSSRQSPFDRSTRMPDSWMISMATIVRYRMSLRSVIATATSNFQPAITTRASRHLAPPVREQPRRDLHAVEEVKAGEPKRP